MIADGYNTILSCDVSGNATRIMTSILRQQYGRWKYKVCSSCRRIWARKTPEHDAATDMDLFNVLSDMGIASMTGWLLRLNLGRCASWFRKSQINSPRDLLVLQPDELSQVFSGLDTFAEMQKMVEDSGTVFTSGTSGHGAVVWSTSQRMGGSGNEHGKEGCAIENNDNDNSESMMTDSSKLQIALSGLRELLGFDVEKGGAGRSFGPNEEFLVCERRFDGSQTHLLLPSGGWVVVRSPSTLEPLCLLSKVLPGGYPPLSPVLNPDSDDTENTFLPRIDYKQMNCLGLELKEDTFDGVIIKATIDTMLCQGDKGRHDVLILLSEVYRVLKPTGKFLLISHGGQHPNAINRVQLLKDDSGNFKWDINTYPLPKPQQPGRFHLAYECIPQPVKPGETWDESEARQF